MTREAGRIFSSARFCQLGTSPGAVNKDALPLLLLSLLILSRHQNTRGELRRPSRPALKTPRADRPSTGRQDGCQASARSRCELSRHFLPCFSSLTPSHLAVGLLKNLAIPDKNKSLLGDAGIIERIVLEMDCFATRLDRVASVQGGAIGILKHLCKGSGARVCLSRLADSPTNISLQLPIPSASSTPHRRNRLPQSSRCSPSSPEPTISPSAQKPPGFS